MSAAVDLKVSSRVGIVEVVVWFSVIDGKVGSPRRRIWGKRVLRNPSETIVISDSTAHTPWMTTTEEWSRA